MSHVVPLISPATFTSGHESFANSDHRLTSIEIRFMYQILTVRISGMAIINVSHHRRTVVMLPRCCMMPSMKWLTRLNDVTWGVGDLRIFSVASQAVLPPLCISSIRYRVSLKDLLFLYGVNYHQICCIQLNIFTAHSLFKRAIMKLFHAETLNESIDNEAVIEGLFSQIKRGP